MENSALREVGITELLEETDRFKVFFQILRIKIAKHHSR